MRIKENLGVIGRIFLTGVSFSRNQIQKKKIFLTGLGLEISVPNNISYFYEGHSPNVESHYEQVMGERYNLKTPNYNPDQQKISTRFLGGQCVPVFNGKFKSMEEALRNNEPVSFHTFVHSNIGVPLSFLRGHEETHLLCYLNKLDFLETKLKKICVQSKGLKEKDTETICSIGGLYAWLRQGNSLRGYESAFRKCDGGVESIEWLKKHSGIN